MARLEFWPNLYSNYAVSKVSLTRNILQASAASPRAVMPQLSSSQPLSSAREADGNDEPQQSQSKSQSIVSLKMENAILRADFAELCARECLSRMELQDATTPIAGTYDSQILENFFLKYSSSYGEPVGSKVPLIF